MYCSMRGLELALMDIIAMIETVHRHEGVA